MNELGTNKESSWFEDCD